MTYYTPSLCGSIDGLKAIARDDLTDWAVKEPDTFRKYTGLVLGTAAISGMEVLAKRWLGCPLPREPVAQGLAARAAPYAAVVQGAPVSAPVRYQPYGTVVHPTRLFARVPRGVEERPPH